MSKMKIIEKQALRRDDVGENMEVALVKIGSASWGTLFLYSYDGDDSGKEAEQLVRELYSNAVKFATTKQVQIEE